MATESASTEAVGPSITSEETAARAVQKRYEGLMTVRAKAIKGKGAWYWAHLEPILVQSNDTGLPKAVKLRCSLCDAVFSASNPSRTASEHLKRGTCPNFSMPPSTSSGSSPPRPISSIPPPPSNQHPCTSSSSGRKRSSPVSSHLALIESHSVYTPPPALGAPHLLQSMPTHGPSIVLSGGKEDLGALAMLEDSVKKLKSPKASPGPVLSKDQVESALSLLCDWFYESCGVVSSSSVDHPKFRDFLRQVGVPPILRNVLTGPQLEARYQNARADAEARIREALFFQLSTAGWREGAIVSVSINLPNGTSVFNQAVPVLTQAPSDYAEELLLDSISVVVGSSAGGMNRCAGIVSDRFKSKALCNLENRNPWMVNLACQIQALHSLLKDFTTDLPLFQSVASNCVKLASFLNTNSSVRSLFHRYQLNEIGYSVLLRVTPVTNSWKLVFPLLEDILTSARPIQMTLLDESYKPVSTNDQIASELAEMVKDMQFWTNLEAVHALVSLVQDMAREVETDRPLVGECLPLWENLRCKVKEWSSRYNLDEGHARKLLERRFKKSYHPAWSASYILDPLNLEKDASGKYLPPFKYLTPEQEKDVDRLITRMVSREEAHIALMELMKWRAEGLNPLYAQAVQVRETDPLTGKSRVTNPQSRRIVWETCLSELRSLGKVAARLIFLHVTARGFRCNTSMTRLLAAHGPRSDRAHKLVFVAAHSKLERKDISNDEDRDGELFRIGDDDDDDVLHDSFGDAPSA
ncbi:F5O11.10 isoform 2 [Rhynchospora pubera]|uniref:F5O11.10 isoform 2 n=1 Tax=Rhynchospora pubera TaxID=906938 RepID=A0AAV8GCV3_9POAL|nr:F5O11.10 isoform 2 [Rhynchospora pubera]